MKIYNRSQIESVINIPELLREVREGLVKYSDQQVMTSPVGFLHFDRPKGDVHIKAGAIYNDDLFVVKIATGFYENPAIGVPSSNGTMLLFSQRTGELKAILHDEGMLTDLRTGLAGAVSAQCLAPKNITNIGIIGTGTQARQQLLCLHYVVDCKDVIVWGRNMEKAKCFAADPALADFRVTWVEDIEELTDNCQLIVTTTPSHEPLLFAHQIKPGTHITAVGADEKGKQELDSRILEIADLVAVDSLSQCRSFGELSYAVENMDAQRVIELGRLVQQPFHRHMDWITVADLTGVAIEDLQTAKAIYRRLIA